MLRRLAFVVLLLQAAAFCHAEVRLGIDVLAQHQFREVRGKRIGLITNPSGVDRKGRRTLDVLRSAPGVKLVALFAPEHGIDGKVRAGNEIESSRDARTGLPIYSLYGDPKKRKPSPAMLKGLDALVYDLQDIGQRSYTFISTMGLAMEACAEAGLEFIVLDRPDPLGGERIEGPMLDSSSFVGLWKVPYIYGMTCGELARMIHGEHWIHGRCRLTVIPMAGWTRSMLWRDTGLRWQAPSPFIPTAESAIMMAATGILGEVGGMRVAPDESYVRWISRADLDPAQLARQLNKYRIPGVSFTPGEFRKNEQVYPATRMEIRNLRAAQLVALNFYLIEAVQVLTGKDLFRSASPDRVSMFDKVSGTNVVREHLQTKKPVSELVSSWKTEADLFRTRREKYLLYK